MKDIQVLYVISHQEVTISMWYKSRCLLHKYSIEIKEASKQTKLNQTKPIAWCASYKAFILIMFSHSSLASQTFNAYVTQHGIHLFLVWNDKVCWFLRLGGLCYIIELYIYDENQSNVTQY